MKALTTVALILFSSLAFAQEFTYDCRPISPLKKPIWVGGDQLVSISKMETKMDSGNPNPVFTLKGKVITQEQIINNFEGKKLAPQSFVDSFAINEYRSGMVLDLKAAPANGLRFIYTIVNMHSFDVATAGPIPEGLWTQKWDLILITEQGSVNTVNLNCNVLVKY